MNLNIAKRIWLMIGLATLALALVGLAGYVGVSISQHTIAEINNETAPRVAAIDDIKSHAYLTRVNALRHNTVIESNRKEAIDKDIVASRQLIDQRFKEYETLARDDTDKKMLAEDRKLYTAYMAALDKLLEYSRQNDNSFARITIDKEFDPIAEQLRQALEAHQKYSREQATQSGKASEAAAKRGEAISGVIVLVGIVAITLLGMLIGRSIIAGLTAVQQTVVRIESELDFTLRVPARGRDELGKMAEALNRLLERLQTNLRSIADSAQSVAQASAGMADTSDQVAHASEAQSGAASSMAASVQELTVSITHIGDRAADTHRTTIAAGQIAESGQAVVGQTVADIRAIAEAVEQASTRIRELNAQSEKISTVVAVIRDVADQTNLLALNAAIEAARAGEQGRGFAVVADEVRKLAERTAKSTQEITAMVDTIRSGAQRAEEGMGRAVERVASGVARTDEISNSIQRIGQSSRHTVEMVNEISGAIGEQASASTSLAQQVEKIAQMADQCSAAAAGSADSAHDLDELANKMSQIVASYKL
ncbi:methyl-accepting chemotaxis protein [Uliginosibacterium gangwonense]|uniref:methyl-accepting chemotaxis protein n=1 Tax=Uliginosibacterium gangwonense TaxID=392736 RepID=UPI000363F473|nr:methyl-accepting chemotaxis protein [Uliginosibacterium gangwonense]